jgi:hypothetical protein
MSRARIGQGDGSFSTSERCDSRLDPNKVCNTTAVTATVMLESATLNAGQW